MTYYSLAASKEKTIEELQKTISDYQKEVEKLKEYIEELKIEHAVEIDELRYQNTRIEKELDEATSLAHYYQDEYKNSESQNEDLRAECSELRSELHNYIGYEQA